jgi:hypothetical protein
MFRQANMAGNLDTSDVEMERRLAPIKTAQ